MPIQRSRNNLNNLYSAMNNVSSAINRHRDDDKKKTYEVEGLFKPLMKNGKFTVVMRFLPAKVGDGDEIPWVENRIHLFQLENGQWFGCDCVGKFRDKDLKCPICEYNSKIWNKYGKTDEARAKVLGKWKPKYYSNVYIVRNDNQPDTVGKVYRFEYSRAIMNFISEAMQDHDDIESGEKILGINPFSYYGPNDKAVLDGEEKAGANFVFEGVQGSNGPNYKTSHFSAPRRINKLAQDGKLYDMTDDEINAIDDQLWTLKDILTDDRTVTEFNKCMEIPDADVNTPYMLDEIQEFVRKRLLRQVQENISNYCVGGKSVGSFAEAAAYAESFTFDTKVGFSFFEEPEVIYNDFIKNEVVLPTGCKTMDEMIHGGLHPQSMNIVLASTNIGKTLIMCSMASAMLLAGKRVLYITFEDPEVKIGQRIMQNLMDKTQNELKALNKLYTIL